MPFGSSSPRVRTATGAFAIVACVVFVPRDACAQGIPTDFVAHWKLDDGSGTTAADSSGSGNNGTLVGGPTWQPIGKIGGALSFDGQDDLVRISNAPPALKPAGSFAISAWVKYLDADTSGGEVATMGDSYGLRVRDDGSVRTYFSPNGTQWTTLTSSAGLVNDDDWHHLVGQYNGAKLEIYIDGVQQAEMNATGQISYTLGANFHLGRHGVSGTNHDFKGMIDQVRVYDHALTPAQIAALKDEAPSNQVTFKVLTWNIHKCRGTDWASGESDNCTRTANAIHTLGADVLLLSAVHDNGDANTILNRLNVLSSGWTKVFAAGGTEGQAIFVKDHVIDSSSSHQVTSTTCSGAETQVILRATVRIGSSTGPAVSFFAIDQQHGSSGGTIRQCQAQAFTAWASAFDEPRIVGGDFNEASGAGMTVWKATYFDAWEEADSPQDVRHGYPGNDEEDSNFGRTRATRLDHILYSESATGLSLTDARVYDMRDLTTTCTDVEPGERIGSACSQSCSCQYIDDSAVRPTDHIPFTVTFTLQQ